MGEEKRSEITRHLLGCCEYEVWRPDLKPSDGWGTPEEAYELSYVDTSDYDKLDSAYDAALTLIRKMREALKRDGVLLKAASDLIRLNHLEGYTAVWDGAECDGTCFLNDGKIAMDDSDDSIAAAEKFLEGR